MKILLVNLGGMGDIVMMAPFIRAIRQKYADAEISFLGISRTIEVARNLKDIDKFYALSMIWRFPKIRDIYFNVKILNKLRSEKFDYLINLRLISSFFGNIKMRFLTEFIGADYSAGRAFFNYGEFYDKVYRENIRTGKNDVVLTLELLGTLGIKNASATLFYPVEDENISFIKKEFENLFDEKTLLVGFNPGAFRPSRMWPARSWRILAGLINEKYPKSKIFITGSASEMNFAKSIKMTDNIVIANGKLNAGQLAALYKEMDIVVSNDSGPMHLAAAVGTKVACIFGPGDANRFSPSVDKRKYRILRTENISLNCERPCYKFKCKNPVCLELITPESVMGKIEELIGNE